MMMIGNGCSKLQDLGQERVKVICGKAYDVPHLKTGTTLVYRN